MDAIVKLGIAFAVAAIGVWDNALSFGVALPVAILIAELGGYWMHRWGHLGWLWTVHGVHHTPGKVNTWNNNTIHFVNSTYSGVAKTLPLALLGFDPAVIVIAAYVTTIQSYAVHANIDVELGWLGYLIMGPAHHRLHPRPWASPIPRPFPHPCTSFATSCTPSSTKDKTSFGRPSSLPQKIDRPPSHLRRSALWAGLFFWIVDRRPCRKRVHDTNNPYASPELQGSFGE